ncbi:glycosyltransferase family 39 protein [Aureispira]|nr:glycosyltransferase family 39 protein [Aureispira sp.]
MFHDELGVYGQGIFYLLDHGPSMIPGDMIPVLSRGHPLFFMFFVSLFTKLLGGSYISAKFVILVLSLALIFCTYLLGKELFGKKSALISAIILSFQPVFFAQSTLILPEIMLALLSVLSILFYIKRRYIWYFFTAALLCLTKETGIVIFAGIALNEWYKNQFRINLKLILTIVKWLAPISCFIIFLIVQKLQHGWFLYPYHTSLISFNAVDICNRFFLGFKHLFYDQGRIILCIAALLNLIGNKEKINNSKDGIMFLFGAIMLIFFAFSSLNYFMVRYQLMVLPIMIISAVALINTKHNKISPKIYIPIYFLLTLPYQYSFRTFSTDANMNYLITVENMQKSISKLDSITKGKAVRVFALFPEIWALKDPRYGYTNNPNYILYDQYNDSCDYIIRGSNNLFDEDAFYNGKIDSLLFDTQALKASKIEKLYESQLYFSKQSIFKTNN